MNYRAYLNSFLIILLPEDIFINKITHSFNTTRSKRKFLVVLETNLGKLQAASAVFLARDGVTFTIRKLSSLWNFQFTFALHTRHFVILEWGVKKSKKINLPLRYTLFGLLEKPWYYDKPRLHALAGSIRISLCECVLFTSVKLLI